MLGHCYPAWNGFDGGKGLATSFGQCLHTFPAAAPVDLALAIGVARIPGLPRAGVVSTAAASTGWLVMSFVWWRRGLPNSWGPKPTAALFVANCATVGIVASRFVSAHRRGHPDELERELSRNALCTDSSSLLSAAAAAELEVDVVPIAVALDGEPFEGSTDAFYARVRAGETATTSQPSPGDFLDAYERAATSGAASVLSLHLDRRVSGVSESAVLAAREATLPVRVVALPTVSYGVGLCVRAASAVLRGGGGVTHAAADAERIAATLDNAFVARAASGGRVSGEEGWTLLRFTAGAASPVRACSARRRGRDDDSSHPGRTTRSRRRRACRSELEAAADRLAHDLVDAAVAAVERYRVAPSVGAHTGPDSFGAFWWPAPRSRSRRSRRPSATRCQPSRRPPCRPPGRCCRCPDRPPAGRRSRAGMLRRRSDVRHRR